MNPMGINEPARKDRAGTPRVVATSTDLRPEGHARKLALNHVAKTPHGELTISGFQALRSLQEVECGGSCWGGATTPTGVHLG